jgi:hypothetical protein
MVTFSVVKEKYGWAIRAGGCMSTPFWSRDAAILEANSLADSIRCHGECAEVVVEGGASDEPFPRIGKSRTARSAVVMQRYWTGRL